MSLAVTSCSRPSAPELKPCSNSSKTHVSITGTYRYKLARGEMNVVSK